ncbi:hypothetical protein HELRODRAFT_67787 [Helobdella robusta]|uniref:Late endosomal/lysosomal adaptor and MAPK and MTOR activator 5 n=1 Tax=Helobdella robusta TaxID=6412 RepID=T1FZ53_HELRO|nr:hypothetical protein HELRODRAFT_67787 [Helobdella robusta]ESN96301.1 hypothetical protein HELRODRAFT_67787 [Helobdella robusta]
MEKPMMKHTQELLDSGATGVLIADPHGLCILAKGCAKSNSAGVITSLFQESNSTTMSSHKTPVVVFETDATKILIQTVENSDKVPITTAIYRNNS